MTTFKQRTRIEDALREKARRNLLAFSCLMSPGYMIGRHTVKMASALNKVLGGEIKRLMVIEPPRHGKSKLISQIFPCFALGIKPRLEIIQAGYSADISLEHSRKGRDLFASPHMRYIFPEVHFYPAREGQRVVPIERQAAHEWGTAVGGRYYSVGVGGGLTGRGGDIAIIDDPVKNREEADSPTIRKRIYDWYRSTLYTRLSPNGAIILVMTRWHTDDLAGRLLREAGSGGEPWHVLHMPAIDKQGNALWPERWNLDSLKSIKTVLGPREWESLYQGHPTAPSGTIFQTEWWAGQNRYDPADAKWSSSAKERILSWDTAEETGETNAYSSCTTSELTPDYKMVIRDVWRDRLEFPQLMQKVISMAEHANRDNKLSAVLIENKSSGIALIQSLRSSGPEWLRKILVSVTPHKSKELRAQEASIWCYNGSVLLPHPSLMVPWLYDLEAELFTFPSSTFKDIVDSFTQSIWYWEHLLAEGCRTTIRMK